MDTPQTVAGERKAVIETSRTMAQFYADVPDVTVSNNGEDVPRETTDEPIVAATEVTEPAAVETEENEEEIKHNPKLQERFSELTAKRKAAEKAAQEAADARETERAARQQAEAERDALKARYEPPKTELGPKPVRDQFISDSDYEQSMEHWATEKAEFELGKKRAAEAAKTYAEQVEKSWKTGVETATKDLPDYAEVVGASKVMLSNEAATAVKEDANGPLILYHMAQNPDIAEKISKMSVPAMNREIGRLSAKLEKPEKQTTGKTIGETVQLSKAPAPISPARGVSASSGGYDTSKMDYATYKALRDAGKIK